MDNFFQAYQQILAKENKENLFDLVQYLSDVILKNIKYFVNLSDYQNYFKLLNFKLRASDSDFSFDQIKQMISDGYKVDCEDNIYLKFKVTDLRNGKINEFYLIPNDLIGLIKDNFDGCFNYEDENFYIFKNKFKADKKFEQNRKKNLCKLEKLNTDNIKPKEETMNDVLLQYMYQFRH